MDGIIMSDTPWIDESYDSPLTSTLSTILPDNKLDVEGSTTTIATLFIIIVLAILVIAFLFSMAVLIDCRQQKFGNKPLKDSGLRINLPSFPSIRILHEDEESIADKMHVMPPDTPNGYF